MNGTLTQYLLDGGNVVGEVTDGTLSALYVRGANLIQMQSAAGEVYYLYNAHGDVVQLTNATGAVVKTYEYDAFGNEEAPVDGDINPFRYCGEYYDTETGLYYLRARYYDPTIGRFTQEDTHWNTANMIYGDNPQKINEREDALGLKTYSYAPQILSILQAGNLYVYCVNSPLRYLDNSGYAVCELRYCFAYSLFSEIPACGYFIGGQSIYVWGENDGNGPFVAFSKIGHTQGDSGLRDVPDEEIARRARDKTLSGKERKRYQTEEKLRGQRNKQKRQSHYSMTETYFVQQLDMNFLFQSLQIPLKPEDAFSGYFSVGAVLLFGLSGALYICYSNGHSSTIQIVRR